MPTIYKTAVVNALLKKSTLERIVSNYRPVSNLPFVSKMIEKCVVKQLSTYMSKNDLFIYIHIHMVLITRLFSKCTLARNNIEVYTYINI